MLAQQLARERGDLIERLFLVCTFACNRLTLREKLEAWSLSWLLRLLGPKRVANAMVAATGRAQGVAALQAIRAFDSRASAHVERPAAVPPRRRDTRCY